VVLPRSNLNTKIIEIGKNRKIAQKKR